MFYCHEHKFMVFMFSHLNFRLGMPVCWRAANSKQTLGLFRCESDRHALPQLKEIKETEKWLGSEQWYFLFFFSFLFCLFYFFSGFCHTLTWISHGFTCVPHPIPPPTSLSTRSLWVFPGQWYFHRDLQSEMQLLSFVPFMNLMRGCFSWWPRMEAFAPTVTTRATRACPPVDKPAPTVHVPQELEFLGCSGETCDLHCWPFCQKCYYEVSLDS